MNKFNIRNIKNTPKLKKYDNREKGRKLWSKGQEYVTGKKKNKEKKHMRIKYNRRNLSNFNNH